MVLPSPTESMTGAHCYVPTLHISRPGLPMAYFLEIIREYVFALNWSHTHCK